MTIRDDLRDRVADAAGLRDLGTLEERVRSLEVAVPENTALATDLERVVERLERAVVEVVDGPARGEVGP